MNSFPYLLSGALLAGASSAALGDIPTLGGPMSHLLVTLFENQIYVTFESPSMATVDMQDNAGEFTGDASVLNDLGYNGQFGWLANGFISLPPSSGIFVRDLGHSAQLNVFEAETFDPIFGTDGSSDVWQWDGTMTHNWYTSEARGTNWANYEVFVGDLAGNPLAGYQSGFIGLNFTYGQDLSGRIGTLGSPSVGTVPAPGSAGLLALSGLVACRRKR